jgi:FtsZ-binding cell division protein ZapB
LDRETVLEQFSKLEKKIEDLIENCKRLEAAKNELKQQNQQLTEQLQEKQSNEQQHDELKGLIRSKIEGLMGKLDGIAGE